MNHICSRLKNCSDELFDCSSTCLHQSEKRLFYIIVFVISCFLFIFGGECEKVVLANLLFECPSRIVSYFGIFPCENDQIPCSDLVLLNILNLKHLLLTTAKIHSLKF